MSSLGRTDCHTGDVGHRFAMTFLGRAAVSRRRDTWVPPYGDLLVCVGAALRRFTRPPIHDSSREIVIPRSRATWESVFPHGKRVRRKGITDCHTGDVGHRFAMTAFWRVRRASGGTMWASSPTSGFGRYTISPNSAQVLLSVIFTSRYSPSAALSPTRCTRRPPAVRAESGQRASSVSPSTRQRRVLPT